MSQFLSIIQLEILWTILFKLRKDKIMQDLISCHIDEAKGCVRIIRSPPPTTTQQHLHRVASQRSAAWLQLHRAVARGVGSYLDLLEEKCQPLPFPHPRAWRRTHPHLCWMVFFHLLFELFFSDGTWFGSFLCIFRGTSPIFWTETSTYIMFKPSKDLLVWFCPSSKMPWKPTQNHSDAAIWTTPPASSHHPVRLRVHSYCGHRAHHSGLHFPPPVALEMQPSEHHPSNLWRYSISPFGVIIKLWKWSNRSAGQTGSSKALHQNPRCCSSHSNWICSFCFQVSHPWCVASTCLRTVVRLL